MVVCDDCLSFLKRTPDDTFDLVFTSPPYEDARRVKGAPAFAGQDWVDWCIPRFMECLRVCKGLVAWVVEGRTRNFCYSATPALLMADLHRAGVKLRKPPVFRRVGIPGSGGPDWLRNDWEWIICATKNGKLPWSDPTAKGHVPKYKNGGACSNRTEWGRRRNNGNYGKYAFPKRANPGNVIHCKVGGGQMGDRICHENEAPFPEKLAEFFIESFCPPGGHVLDPFCGSGTTLVTAERTGRLATGVDIRESQVKLTNDRLENHRFVANEL